MHIHRALKMQYKNLSTHHIAFLISRPIFAISILTDKGFATIAQEKVVEYLHRMTKYDKGQNDKV